MPDPPYPENVYVPGSDPPAILWATHNLNVAELKSCVLSSTHPDGNVGLPDFEPCKNEATNRLPATIFAGAVHTPPVEAEVISCGVMRA